MKVLARSSKFLRAPWRVVSLACVVALGGGVKAAASVSLLVEQPYGHLGHFDPAGHSAIYLDHVCAASPVELRPCRPDELGVVISRYDNLSGRDWVAIPLIAYLYAVDSADEIPESVDKADVARLRESYRREHLQMVAGDRPDGTAPENNWTQLVGASFDRAIYGFRVRTTPEQDEGLIAQFNDRANVEHYNGFFRNCADFARTTINRYYPHAVRRNIIADFGITSPKSVARSLTHYAKKHPEADLEVFKIDQVRGELPRSHATQDVSESLLKKYGLPLVVISPQMTAVVLAVYIGHGRFAMPKDPPTLDVAALQAGAQFPSPSASQTADRKGEGEFPVLLSRRPLVVLPEATQPPVLPEAPAVPVVEAAGDGSGRQ